MPKINREEYEILKALDGYTHLARDKNRFRDKSLLQAYQIKPNRKEYLWVNPNNTDVEDLDENLFQFIQWEDEEPYEIAELIEEYESEETEVLSWEWIDENQELQFYEADDTADYFVRSTHLQNLLVPKQEITESFKETVRKLIETSELAMDVRKLTGMTLEEIAEEARNGGIVPKQELPVIPQFIADYLPLVKEDVELERASYYAVTNNELPKWKKEYDWIRENFETFVRAWLAYPNIEVEEEQKYRVENSHGRTLLAKMTYSNKGKTFEKVEPYNELIVGYKKELTEQEIKDYDERYFAFAVKVEELGE